MGLSEVFTNRPDLLVDEKRLKGVLSDYYAGDEAQVRRMMRAYEVGTVSVLLNGKKDILEKKKLIDKLVNLHDMQESKAQEAVDAWFAICTPKVIAAVRKYQNEKETAIKEEKAKNNREKTEQKKAAQEKRAKEEADREATIAAASKSITTDYYDYNRYLNVDLSQRKLVMGIPCGVGNSDYGFIVKGAGRTFSNINSYDEEYYPTLIAIVYNFLVRNTHITKESYPQYMRTHKFDHELDYGHIYRYIMILLEFVQLGKDTSLHLNVIGDEQELVAAVDILNEYLTVFGRLIRAEKSSIVYIPDATAQTISAEYPADLCVENYLEEQGIQRRIRYGRRVNYNLNKNDKADLEFLLREISPFKSFKKGQFNALCSMLNANDHAVCIMPTGSGKSLIYYFASLLQPQTVFVVSPTDILIRDQIRNLQKFHHYDSATHLILKDENDYSFFRPGTNIVFLTPSTFQNKNLFGIFKRHRKKICYVVLDEIHCISNWGHDFRPEYLMLSRNMLQYLDEARYLGFTATANYTVAQDIQKQLNIPLDNFFSPILFEKNNIKYDFREIDNTDCMLREVAVIANEIVRRNERAIVFTKNDDISRLVADAIGYEADVFTSDQPDAYSQFAEGYCKILVANEDIGIGINLPNVNCTVHFGIPLSKNEFVQEIGRAGRADERVTAYVIYLKPTKENIPVQLLKRDTIVDNLPQMLAAMKNDYSDVYRKLNCGSDTSEIMYDRLVDVFSDFHSGGQAAYIVNHPINTIEPYKQYLYMLYVTGYIKDWYSYRAVGTNKITIVVDICSDSSVSGIYRGLAITDSAMLERMKRASRDYFANMGNDRESIFLVSKAKSLTDVLHIYVKWYYDKFLYHHKEQFLDFFEFLTGNSDGNTLKITEEIEDYFNLPFVRIKEDEEYYSNLSFEEISRQAITGIGKNTLTNLERINSDSYSYKLDYLLFAGNWNRWGRFDVNRLERVWNNLSSEEQEMLLQTIVSLFKNAGIEARWNCLKYFDDKNNVTAMSLEKAVETLYSKAPKDILYYGIVTAKANELFSQFIRRN